MKERQVIVQSLQGIPFRINADEKHLHPVLLGFEAVHQQFEMIQAGRSFKPDQNARIVAFLKTLTGRQPTFQIPVLPPSSNSTPGPNSFSSLAGSTVP